MESQIQELRKRVEELERRLDVVPPKKKCNCTLFQENEYGSLHCVNCNKLHRSLRCRHDYEWDRELQVRVCSNCGKKRIPRK